MLITKEHQQAMLDKYMSEQDNTTRNFFHMSGFEAGVNATLKLVDEKLWEEKRLVIPKNQRYDHIEYNGLDLTVFYDFDENYEESEFYKAFIGNIEVTALLSDDAIEQVEYAIDTLMQERKRDIADYKAEYLRER